MSFPHYLAMTAAEFSSAQILPAHIAWMACHFSLYGTGLSNFPPELPDGSMLIVNDRIPIHGHDPSEIVRQLQEFVALWKPDGLLLDFQRPDMKETARLAALLVTELPCPVGVTAHYAKGLDCPVFLSPPPMHTSLEAYLSAWSGGEIWLEAALENQCITVTEEGSRITCLPFQPLEEPIFSDPKLHCNYHMDIQSDSAVFTASRDPTSLIAFLDEAKRLGVTKVIGLYQELKDIN